MPIFRANGRLVYYCHVPKAAGTALEAYLATQFGQLAFVDQGFLALSPRERWSRSSPQHIDAASLERLFPPGFFDAIFAVVRHPVTRLVSAFKFKKFVEGRISVDVDFKDWVSRLRQESIQNKWNFDHHLLPQCQIVPCDARVFRLEDGLDPVIAYLQDLAGPSVTLPCSIAPANVTSGRLLEIGIEDLRIEVDEESRTRISEIYRQDFERFGYACLDDGVEPDHAGETGLEEGAPA